MDVIEKRVSQRNLAIDRAREFAKSLTEDASVFLIGSYSRGDFNLWSDIDVVVISNFEGNLLSRLKSMDFPPGFEIIPLTVNEFKKMRAKKNPICVELERTGILLRDDLKISILLTDSGK
ncbi:MAG: hypothetical protein B2I17_09210 [Thermoplasmatales archaeon B_DKE]|nr:MAG: hypothetical protein B2I17_09210 [Thermoplasmatales archaeon B_DKE]